MNKTPISIIFDDPAPRISVYYEHARSKFTTDGRPLVSEYPNSFLDEFCALVKKYGIRGKFSIVPMPGGKGTLASGIEGFDYEEIKYWLDKVKSDLSPYFTFCPEMLTHARAVDLKTGKLLDMNEDEWSKEQDRSTLTPYISKALELLKEVDIEAFGVSSPWRFGIDVEDEYIEAISQAVYNVSGRTDSWYLGRNLYDKDNARPWIALNKNGKRVVSIPCTIFDNFWYTKDTTETSDEYLKSIADKYITEDGKKGRIIEILETNGYPILITHWQSMYSNGLKTGLKALELVVERVNKNLSNQVKWTNFETLMNIVLENPDNFPKPSFL